MQQSILITGCSSGIGYHAAIALKTRGYRVFAGARKAADIEKLQSAGLEAVLLDVNDNASIKQGLDQVLQQTGGTLDALFSNAGYLQTGAIDDLTREMNIAQFETNVFGAVELTRQVLAVMRNQGHGRIIQTGSILGIVAIPYCGAYNASKFAIEGYYQTLRQELRSTSIHVSIINPGPIHSQLRDNALLLHRETIEKQSSGVHDKVYEKMQQSYFKRSPKNQAFSLGPDAVTKKLIHALESNHPKMHYYVGIPAHGLALLRRLLPDCVLEWILVKVR